MDYKAYVQRNINPPALQHNLQVKLAKLELLKDTNPATVRSAAGLIMTREDFSGLRAGL